MVNPDTKNDIIRILKYVIYNISNSLKNIIQIFERFVGTYSRISQVLLYQQVQDIIFNRKTESVPFYLYFEFEIFYIPLSLIFVRKIYFENLKNI